MGSKNIKKVKGHEYLYYVVHENGKKRTRYCGPVSDGGSNILALEFEIEELIFKKNYITQNIQKLRERLARMKLKSKNEKQGKEKSNLKQRVGINKVEKIPERQNNNKNRVGVGKNDK